MWVSVIIISKGHKTFNCSTEFMSVVWYKRMCRQQRVYICAFSLVSILLDMAFTIYNFNMMLPASSLA